MENPNRWVIVEIKTPKETIQKVFAGWSGGYLDGDSWKLNSGIVEAKEDGDYWLFTGHSGNVYRCFKYGYGMTNYMGSIYSSWIKQLPEDTTMTILDNYPAA